MKKWRMYCYYFKLLFIVVDADDIIIIIMMILLCGGGVEMNILKIHCWNNPNMKLNHWKRKLLKTLLTHTDPY